METLAIDRPDQNQSVVDQLFTGIIANSGVDFESVFQEELNIWQRTAKATNDIVTPANGIDAISFASSIYGINNLDSWKGIFIAMGSFMADFVDGKVARATGTQSDLGEAVDAAGDKIKLAYALYKIHKLELAPKPLILAVAAQNGLNATLTAADRILNDDPVIHPNQAGKKAIFAQQWGLGLHVIGSQVEKNNQKRGKAIKAAGSVLGYTGVAVGGVASTLYASSLIKSRKRANNS